LSNYSNFTLTLRQITKEEKHKVGSVATKYYKSGTDSTNAFSSLTAKSH